MMGLRELTLGAGILTARTPAPWLAARTAGDIVDLGAIALAGASEDAQTGRLVAAGAAVAAITVLDALTTRKAVRARGSNGARGIASVLINRPPEECYRTWRDLERLPSFLKHVKSIRVIGERRSHWIVEAPPGNQISWDAEITDDVPNELIAWRSIDGGAVTTSGRVRFEGVRGGRGTIVRVLMNYELPLGSEMLQALLPGRHDPGGIVRRELLGFKQLIETGEISTTEGQPSGRGGEEGATVMDRLARV